MTENEKMMTTMVIVMMVMMTGCQGFTCPDGSTPTTPGKIFVETCQNPDADGSCPIGSDGLALSVTGAVPKFTWGLLQSGDYYKVQFHSLYQEGTHGNPSLSSWKWHFCPPTAYSSGNSSVIDFVFFGTSKSGDASIYIEVQIVNSSSTTSFKWTIEIENYQLTAPLSDLVLYATYTDQLGHSQIERNQDSTGIELQNGNSYIFTVDSALLNGAIEIPVNVTQDSTSGKGYYIVFALADSGYQIGGPFDLVLDPEMGIITNGATTLLASAVLVLSFFILFFAVV